MQHPSVHFASVYEALRSDQAKWAVAMACLSAFEDPLKAAEHFVDCMIAFGWLETPEGLPFTVESVSYAMRGLHDESG